ncbi:hypothetical protein RI129_002852 [Pyrocoelia pectoralis]|uniref:Uncharacterized protein n=1 Tax=Pyrocoelia pectoralis TaxID=417401 RepID=A0AAN7ZI80_9COLE
MYVYALMKYPNIESITHKFLIMGHTQNEGDSAHSIIERQIKRSLKSGPIFLPAQYAELIKCAKKTGKPYFVKERSFTDFFDLKALNEQIGTFDGRTNNTEDKLTDFKIIKIEREDPFKIKYKTTYAQEDFHVWTIKKPRAKVNKKDQLKLQPLYKNKIKLPDKKKNGLLELCAKKHIPIYHHEFYSNL